MARYGNPPTELKVVEATSADLDRGFPRESHNRVWLRDKNGIVECKPADLSRLKKKGRKTSGMYWQVGTINFHVNFKKKIAVYSYVLGPRYGRGYKQPYEELDDLILTIDGKHMVWLS